VQQAGAQLPSPEKSSAESKHLCEEGGMFYSSFMSATEIIEQFKALPPGERAQVAKFVVENDDSWIPESFKEGIADAEAGRFDLDTALREPYPGDQ
jgi:hypothetical protein